MCLGKSRTGARITALFAVLLLLASPCFSAGYLAELLGLRSRAGQSSQQSLEEQQSFGKETLTGTVESYQVTPQQLQGMSETELLQRVQDLSSASEKVSTDFRNELTAINGSLESLKTQLDSLKGVNAISDEMYSEALTSLNNLAEKNTTLSDENAYNSGYIAGLEKKERQTKFFANTGVVLGFSNSMPTWGVTGNMGIKLGRGLMVGTGLNYMIGDFTSPVDLVWDLDKLSINATIGWEW